MFWHRSPLQPADLSHGHCRHTEAYLTGPDVHDECLPAADTLTTTVRTTFSPIAIGFEQPLDYQLPAALDSNHAYQLVKGELELVKGELYWHVCYTALNAAIQTTLVARFSGISLDEGLPIGQQWFPEGPRAIAEAHRQLANHRPAWSSVHCQHGDDAETLRQICLTAEDIAAASGSLRVVDLRHEIGLQLA